MRFNEDMAAIHAYLCADGYVITNPPSQKHKYYYIGLRNTELTLLTDFQSRFERVFGIKPIITTDGRCKIQNKKIFLELTKEYSYYSDRWNPPRLSKNELSFWLRAYFDCDGWVAVIKAKDRKIGLESINYAGIVWIQKILESKFGINSSVSKHRNKKTYALRICGRDDLLKFKNKIGFLHPRKKEKLEEAIASYETLVWVIPEERSMLVNFVLSKAKLRKSHHHLRIFSIHKTNLTRLSNALRSIFGIKARLLGPWTNPYGSSYFCLILKEGDLQKFNISSDTLRY